jgi:hypothetical protein
MQHLRPIIHHVCEQLVNGEAKGFCFYWCCPLTRVVKVRLTNLIHTVATPLWPSVGVKPNTPKVGDLESFGTPECLEFDSKAQNYSH